MHHTPRKRFGQNFLQDQFIISQIIDCIHPLPNENIVEIGPGLAALTKPLMELIDHIDLIEIDRDIVSYLQTTLPADKITIHEGDALNFDYSFNNQQIRVIGNLPYNISTPLMFHLAKFDNVKDMTFMLQKEVVDRICAKVNSKDYGKLTVMLQYKFKCTKLLEVPATAFYPAPKVESAILKLQPRTDYAWQEVDQNKLNLIVSTAFNQRRKTIHNSLKSLVSNEQMISENINPQLRAENLSLEDFLKLTKFI